MLRAGEKKDGFLNYRAFDLQLLYFQFTTVLPLGGRTLGKYWA